jgi:hypothetical protein
MNAHLTAVLYDIGLMPIKSLGHPELGILRALNRPGLGSPATCARSPDPHK